MTSASFPGPDGPTPPAPEGPRRRPRRRLRRLAGLALLALALGLAAEFAVRAVWGPQPRLPRRVVSAPWGLRFNEPGARYRHRTADGEWEFRINAQGMRADVDYAYERPPGRLRVISLGDSYTVGYEVDVEQTFSSVLERELRAAGLDAEVLNCGMSGCSNAEELLYLERELLKYEPDVVICSFYGNDLADNVRTGLFRIVDGALQPWNETYVPGGALGDFLNRNAVFNALSEHSHAFSFLNFRATLAIKRWMVAGNAEEVVDAGAPPPPADAGAQAALEELLVRGTPEERALCAAIFERLYATCRARGIPLVIQSIPRQFIGHGEPLFEQFPLEEFDVARPGLAFVSGQELLEPFVDDTELFYADRTGHWTPFSHERSGRALAQRLLDGGLLEEGRRARLARRVR